LAQGDVANETNLLGFGSLRRVVIHEGSGTPHEFVDMDSALVKNECINGRFSWHGFAEAVRGNERNPRMPGVQILDLTINEVADE
jgi:hypothetical protein